VAGTLSQPHSQANNGCMDAQEMERVWHGSHRKGQAKMWQLAFVWCVLGLVSISVLMTSLPL
jgi:hypothetical protein